MPRGQIIARSPTIWLLRIYQGREPATGKRRYLNKTVEGERSAAEAELARLLTQIPPRPRASSTLDQYLDWWLYAAVDGRLRASSARDYRTLLAPYLRPELGKNQARPPQTARPPITARRSHQPGTLASDRSLHPRGLEKRARPGPALEANGRESSRRHAAAPRRQTRVPSLDARGGGTLYFLVPRGSGGTGFSGGVDHGPAAQRISGAPCGRL